MRKKTISMLLSLTTAVTMMSGTGVSLVMADDAAEGSDLEASITYVTQNDQTGTVDKMIEAFNEKYPNITVDHQSLTGASDDVKKSLMISLAAGDSDPDVFDCDSVWVPQFAAAGWLLDVTDAVEARKDEWLEGPLKTCYYDDKAYAYPEYTDVGLLYYRKDIIDTAPTTWDELVQICNEHKDETKYGFIFQMFQGEPTSCNMLEFIKQNGGTDLQDDGTFAMNNENTIGALEFVESLINDGISPEGVLSHKPDDSRGIFEEGEALMMRNWTYAWANAQSDTSKVKDKVGVAKLPVGTNGTKSSGTLGGWDYAINVNTDEEEASRLFVEFMSSYDAQVMQTEGRGVTPCIAAVYEDPEVLEVMPYLTDAKEAVDEAEPRPQVTDYPAISSVFQIYFHKALTGELSNEDAMAQMDEELNKTVSE